MAMMACGLRVLLVCATLLCSWLGQMSSQGSWDDIVPGDGSMHLPSNSPEGVRSARSVTPPSQLTEGPRAGTGRP